MDKTSHIQFDIYIIDSHDKDSFQSVKVMPDVTVGELLSNTVQTFSNQLPKDETAYCLVDKTMPQKPLPEDAKMLEIKGIQSLLIRDKPKIIPCLTLESGEQMGCHYPLLKGEVTIGRKSTNPTISLDWDLAVSNNSAIITKENNDFFIKKLNDKKNLWLDGEIPKKDDKILLRPNQIIQFGNTKLKFEYVYDSLIRKCKKGLNS